MTPAQVCGGVVVLFVMITIPLGLHTVAEGHVGVYWRGACRARAGARLAWWRAPAIPAHAAPRSPHTHTGGALLNRMTEPGFNLKIPYLDM